MLPPWLKTRLPTGENFERIKALSAKHGLHTVCEEARCPNVAECWGGGTATFMVMGDTCTRGCRFCSVSTALKPRGLDADEPAKLAETIADLGLDYVVVTTVCRDDLPDQGADHIVRCIHEIRRRSPDLLLEVLIQDFRGDFSLLGKVVNAGAHVIAHNVETVERLTRQVRDARAGYRQSLDVLEQVKKIDPSKKTKSSLMLGLGERESEVMGCLHDLRQHGVDIITIGQYLQPGKEYRYLPVEEYVTPKKFDEYGERARQLGFLYVASGPFVRSSYRAGELFLKGLLKNSSSAQELHHAA